MRPPISASPYIARGMAHLLTTLAIHRARPGSCAEAVNSWSQRSMAGRRSSGHVGSEEVSQDGEESRGHDRFVDSWVCDQLEEFSRRGGEGSAGHEDHPF